MSVDLFTLIAVDYMIVHMGLNETRALAVLQQIVPYGW